jgi:hypothetical protein
MEPSRVRCGDEGVFARRRNDVDWGVPGYVAAVQVVVRFVLVAMDDPQSNGAVTGD